MYYDYFGLTQPPFRITPNTDFFFSGGNRGAILDALIYAVGHGEGIVKVTGEVGSGKTMLCSMMQSRLPDHVETVYLANPSVGPDEVLHAIAVELQLNVKRTAGRLMVMHELQDYLLKRHANHRRVVVFIEESQSMPVATLEEIRLLSNLETRNEKLMQIVLFGQPELDETLRQPNIRQLRDRIAHSFRLEPLDASAVREYLSFRMRAAGYKGPEVFSARVVRQITQASSGLTRRINLIADKALLAAFSENTHTIRPKHVAAALRDSEFSDRSRIRSAGSMNRFAWPAAAMAVGLVAGASFYALLDRPGASAYSPTLTETVTAPRTVVAAASPHNVPNNASDVAATAALPAASDEHKPRETKPLAAKEASPGREPPQKPAESRKTAIPPDEGGTEDVLAARRAATERWLEEQPGTAYSIQLLGTGDEKLLKEHLNVLAKSVEMQKIFVYRVGARGRPWLNVVYGEFPDRPKAQQALETLPPALKAFRPMLRTVQGIRAELAQHGL